MLNSLRTTTLYVVALVNAVVTRRNVDEFAAAGLVFESRDEAHETVAVYNRENTGADSVQVFAVDVDDDGDVDDDPPVALNVDDDPPETQTPRDVEIKRDVQGTFGILVYVDGIVVDGLDDLGYVKYQGTVDAFRYVSNGNNGKFRTQKQAKQFYAVQAFNPCSWLADDDANLSYPEIKETPSTEGVSDSNVDDVETSSCYPRLPSVVAFADDVVHVATSERSLVFPVNDATFTCSTCNKETEESNRSNVRSVCKTCYRKIVDVSKEDEFYCHGCEKETDTALRSIMDVDFCEDCYNDLA